MKIFLEAKKILIELGIYKNAIATDYTNKSIYITIPYGSIKNSGKTKVYKIPTKLNFNRIQKYWFESIDKNKILNY
jgi:hypothetical protein